MNPVEGFLFLDNIDDEEVKMKLMGTLPGQHGGFGVERSIGGADLSGIVAVDDEDIGEDAGLVRELNEKVQDGSGGGEDSWDSANCKENAGGVRDRVVSADSVKGGGFGEVDETGEREKPLALLADDDTATLTRGSATGSWNTSSHRNPNISSPTLPVEEGSDWDGAGDKSSEDLEFLDFRKPPYSYETLVQTNMVRPSSRGETRTSGGIRPSTTNSQSPEYVSSNSKSPKLEVEGASMASDSSGRGRRLLGISSVKPSHTLTAVSDGESKRRAFPSQLPIDQQSPSKLTKPLVRDEEKSTLNFNGRSCQVRIPERVAESQDGSSMATKAAAAEAEAAIAAIESLQTELCRLREHVLRSEQRREEQLREFEKRLKEQERRVSARARGGTPPQQGVLDGEGDIIVDEGGEEKGAGEDSYDGGTETPHKVAGHNPFVPTAGGAETPRVHFPAFEEALHDGRKNSAPKGTESDADGAVVDKSVLQDEAFEFSIDTLSHINNHTNFGIGLPVQSMPVAKAAIWPEVSRGRNSSTSVKSRTAKRAPDEASNSKGGDPSEVAEETEEAFDDVDRAAEEAFFADAHATASLQTPVKHAVGIASSVAAVAVREARMNSRSSCGSSGERSFVEGEQPRGSQAEQSLTSERRDHNAIDVLGCKNASPSNSCEFESSGVEQEELCMADFFVRASAVLDSRMDRGSSERARTSVCDGIVTGASEVVPKSVVSRSPSCAEVCFMGVDVATQTTWSFAAHEQVRFVSSSDRMLMADGKNSLQESGVESRDISTHISDPSDPSRLTDLLARQSLRETVNASGWKGARSVQLQSDRVQRGSSIPRCTFPLQSKARERNFRENGGNPLSEERSVVPERCGLYDSPKVSPTVDTRKSTDRAASGVAGFSYTSHEKEDSRERALDGTSPTRRPFQRGRDHFLSPIPSQSNPSLSLSGDARSLFDPLPVTEEWKSFESSSDLAGMKSRKQDGDASDKEMVESFGHEQSSSVKDLILKAAAELATGDASVDATRSSLLRVSTRASTTLETIAPLGDDSNDRSISFHSRVVDSCHEELFAERRLPSWGDSAPPRQSRNLRPPLASEESRSGSAPTLPSEFPEDNVVDRERSVRQPQGATGVPPAVVGACLAAAIKGLYGNGQHDGGDVSGTGDVVDQCAESTQSGRCHGPRAFGAASCANAVLSRSPHRNVREGKANESSQRKQSISMGIQVYEENSRDPRSPLPPPPPPQLPLNVQNGLVGCHVDDGDEMTEEDIFYQRQHLLRRVVCAAASHGSVMSLSAQGAAAAANVSKGVLPMKLGQDARSVDMVCSPRRHSDPLSWKANSEVATAVSTGVGNSPTGAGGRTARGSGSYRWRRTSEYWRDRLGMTQ